MQIKASYHLSSYRINEYESGVLWWESHFDFGKQRSGECFIHGNILIIKPWIEEKDGLLIGEFLDQVRKLPFWNKTTYYCFASELLDSNTGRRLTAEQLKQISLPMKAQGSERDELMDLLPGSFRINRYCIAVSDDQTISWQTPKGMDKIIGGEGRIESGILFLGPMMGGEKRQNKQEFLLQISRLPQWTITNAWCRYSSLRFCREKEKNKSAATILNPPKKSTDPNVRDHPSSSYQRQKKELPPEQLSSTFTTLKPLPSFSFWRNKLKWPKFSWPGFSNNKIWITGLIFFLFSGLIVALIIIFHELEEKSYRPYWYKKNHHEHRGEHHSQSGFPIIFSIILLSLFSSLTFTRQVYGEEKHIILEESGIHYPGGFDQNTVGEVRGKASHVSRPGRGPVHFLLSTDRELYMVLTSPYWYWEENHIKIPEGTEVFVRGSKSFGRDGHLYIIAQELGIPTSGLYFVFRGKDGTPLWKNPGRPKRESQAGFGSSSGGRGGVGAGGGSRGHGRR